MPETASIESEYSWVYKTKIGLADSSTTGTIKKP